MQVLFYDTKSTQIMLAKDIKDLPFYPIIILEVEGSSHSMEDSLKLAKRAFQAGIDFKQ